MPDGLLFIGIDMHVHVGSMCFGENKKPKIPGDRGPRRTRRAWASNAVASSKMFQGSLSLYSHRLVVCMYNIISPPRAGWGLCCAAIGRSCRCNIAQEIFFAAVDCVNRDRLRSTEYHLNHWTVTTCSSRQLAIHTAIQDGDWVVALW